MGVTAVDVDSNAEPDSQSSALPDAAEEVPASDQEAQGRRSTEVSRSDSPGPVSEGCEGRESAPELTPSGGVGHVAAVHRSSRQSQAVAEGTEAGSEDLAVDPDEGVMSVADMQASVLEEYVKGQPDESSGVMYGEGAEGGVPPTAAAADADAQPGTAAILEEYVHPERPRPAQPISQRAAIELMRVLRLCTESNKPGLVSVALSTLQQLVAQGYLAGAVTSLMLEGEGRIVGEAGMHARGLSTTPQHLDVPAQVLHLVCSCDDYCHDEEVEVAVVRTILTIVTSTTFSVHGMVLLLVIRACYNIYIMSRSETNQVTAKAALTQIVNVVFQRLAAGDVVRVRPVVTPELLAIGGREQRRDLATAQEVVTSVWESMFGASTDGGAPAHPPADAFTASQNLDARSEDMSPVVPHRDEALALPAGELASIYASNSEANLHGSTHGASSNGVASASRSPAKPGSAGTVERDNASTLGRDRAQLLEGASKVFRALCKLAVRSSNVPGDMSVSRGRILAMELLAVVLINNGADFKHHPRLLALVKAELGDCLLANCKSSLSMLQRLTCNVFVVVLRLFRKELKTKVAYLFRNTLLKGVEPVDERGAVDLEYRQVVLRCLRPVCRDGQLLMDLFVNFDCDPERTDSVLLERLFRALVHAANSPDTLADPGGPDMLPAHRNRLRSESLSCITQMLKALFLWHSESAGLQLLTEEPAESDATLTARLAEEPGSRLTLPRPEGRDAGEELQDKKEKKRLKAEGMKLFADKPKKGIAQLQAAGVLGTAPAEVARFLKEAEGLDYAAVGEFLSDPSDDCRKVMHEYVDSMDFTNMMFDDAIRNFLLDFRLPGEAQKIDRLMEKFAERFHVCNSPAEDYPFANAQTAYVLAYSVIMLNTDQHNPTIKKRMTMEEFVRNNRGINDEKDLPRPFLEALYERIRTNQIMMRHTMMQGEQPDDSTARDASFLNTIFSMFGRSKEIRAEPTEAQIAQLSAHLRDKTKNLTFYPAQDPHEARPLVEAIWEYVLPTLSTLFSESPDQLLLNECLQGLVEASCLTCGLHLSFISAAFIRTLANFTSLHEPHNMKIKNAHALRQLLTIPERVGNQLHDNWIMVLRCLSRWALMSQIASGSPTDLALFATIDPAKQHEVRKSWWSMGRKQAAKEASRPPSQPGTLLDAGTDISRDFLGKSPPPGVMDAIDEDMLTRIFVTSSRLDSEAFIEFFQALTNVSCEELRGKPTARVFALTKVVEVCHHNMMRPRIVWTSIWKGTHSGRDGEAEWHGLSEYFVDTGCHDNLQVAMYAMDALRQIAEKFLERDELANYSFQNDFLKPFVVVMRQSDAKEIRELIIRQASRMVLSRVGNIKSGWKSMFMIFSQAAKDREPTIVRLAFDTIEKIVREHFTCITETDVAVFADCVNCLTAFTNQDHDDDVALNAIAFLRFCAMRLAEGSIGDVDTLPEEVDVEAVRQSAVTRFKPLSAGGGGGELENSGADAGAAPLSRDGSVVHSRSASVNGRRFSDHEEHLYFWMPLLIGLTELTFDPRPKIRYSALEVLFNTLSEHGSCYTEGFWNKVFDRMLLPIFDCVQMGDIDLATFSRNRLEEEEKDRWLYETCSHCLHHLIDLVVKFYPLVRWQLPQVLNKIKAFMTRAHHSLASVGVAALERLIQRVGPQLTEDMWVKVTAGILQVAEETRPDVAKVADFPAGRYYRPGQLPESRQSESGGGADERPPSTDVPLVPGHPSHSAASDMSGASDTKTVYSLVDGLGMRRLQHVRVRVHVQLLLVQACAEIYGQHHARMPASAVATLLSVMTEICSHARKVNTDDALRRCLAQWQAEDGVQIEASGLSDPPLMKLETDTSSTLLSLLMHLFSATGAGADDRRRVCRVQQRLFQLCYDNLQRFDPSGRDTDAASTALEGTVNSVDDADAPAPSRAVSATTAGKPVLMASSTAEHQTLAPVIVSTLSALRAFSDDQFKECLKPLFPLMTRLIRCSSAPLEVQVALSELFATRVGPLL